MKNLNECSVESIEEVVFLLLLRLEDANRASVFAQKNGVEKVQDRIDDTCFCLKTLIDGLTQNVKDRRS